MKPYLCLFCLPFIELPCVSVGVLVTGRTVPFCLDWVLGSLMMCQLVFQFRLLSLLSGRPSLLTVAREIFRGGVKQDGWKEAVT